MKCLCRSLLAVGQHSTRRAFMTWTLARQVKSLVCVSVCGGGGVWQAGACHDADEISLHVRKAGRHTHTL
jgi:hypothetical protein